MTFTFPSNSYLNLDGQMAYRTYYFPMRNNLQTLLITPLSAGSQCNEISWNILYIHFATDIHFTTEVGHHKYLFYIPLIFNDNDKNVNAYWITTTLEQWTPLINTFVIFGQNEFNMFDKSGMECYSGTFHIIYGILPCFLLDRYMSHFLKDLNFGTEMCSVCLD